MKNIKAIIQIVAFASVMILIGLNGIADRALGMQPTGCGDGSCNYNSDCPYASMPYPACGCNQSFCNGGIPCGGTCLPTGG